MEKLTKQTYLEKIFDFENAEKWIFKGTRPAVLDFYENGEEFSDILAKTIEELEVEYKDKIDFYSIDTDEEEFLSEAYDIESIPTLIFIPVGSSPQEVVGLVPKKDFIEIIDEIFGIKATEIK